MAEWTPDAQEYLDGYLRQVATLARRQGDDADEIVAELRDHIERELEMTAGAVVALDALRKTLAAIGTPEQVVGVGSTGLGDKRRLPPEAQGLHLPQPSPRAVRNTIKLVLLVAGCVLLFLLLFVALTFA